MKIENINSLVELYFKKYDEIKNKKGPPFLFGLSSKDKNYSLNWNEVTLKIKSLTTFLQDYISPGDRCVLLSENRPQWLIADIAIMNSGGVTVPLFTTYSDSDYEYIINDCGPKVCIVSNKLQYEKIEKFLNDKIKIISIDEFTNQIENFSEIFKKTNFTNKSYNDKIKRNDLACIIYTSGTTGKPKGVMLSHGGILSNCEGALEILASIVKKKKPVFLTWLPLSHSYEHTVQFVQISLGAKVYYAESLDKLIPNMSVAKPTIMTAVPRFYQNLYNKISLNFSKMEGLKKKLITNTLKLGTKKLKKENLNFGEKISNFLCEILVRKKIKKQFGGELQAFVSGGGALDQKIGEFLNSIGLPTLQGYGLTEASPVVSCNVPGNIQIETVGPPFKTNEDLTLFLYDHSSAAMSNSKTKKDIVRTIAEESGLTQQTAKELVQNTLDAIVQILADNGRIELRNFGVFECKERKARIGRNPKTGDPVDVPAKFVVTFKPGKAMENRIREANPVGWNLSTFELPEVNSQALSQSEDPDHPLPPI